MCRPLCRTRKPSWKRLQVAIDADDLQNRIEAYANVTHRVDAAGRRVLSNAPQTHGTSLCQEIAFIRFPRILSVSTKDGHLLTLKVRSGRVFAIRAEEDPENWATLEGREGQRLLQEALAAVVQSAEPLFAATARWIDAPHDGATGVSAPEPTALSPTRPAGTKGKDLARIDLVDGTWCPVEGQLADIARLQALAQMQFVTDWLSRKRGECLILGGAQQVLIEKNGISLVSTWS